MGVAPADSAHADLDHADLGPAPIDPTTVTLTAGVRAFGDCDELLSTLRQLGAAHVGSRGFGANQFWPPMPGGMRLRSVAAEGAFDAAVSAGAGQFGGETIGTNVQIDGVDELDVVKARGTLVYRLMQDRLFIADIEAGDVVGYLPLDTGDGARRFATSASLLVGDGWVLVVGTEAVQSEPIAADPSAATSSHQFVTITTVDATDPAAPVVTERIRIAGHLVAARLVGDKVRLVVGSHLPDIGFVMPTSPESIAVALEQNRRAVAASEIVDWLPAWDTGNGSPARPLVECASVVVPETFAGVSMTTLAEFEVGQPFEPSAMSLVAPSTDVYATATDVTVASHIWVDPAVAYSLPFANWRTALHQFRFGDAGPTYVGSAAVDGSVSGQFAFGQVGDRLGVIAAAGTPWSTSAESEIALHLFDTTNGMDAVGSVGDIGRGASIRGVRFTPERVVVTTSTYPPQGGEVAALQVVDVSDPALPRVAGSVDLPGAAGHLHPIDGRRFLAFGSRAEQRADFNHVFFATVVAVDTTNADRPRCIGTWEAESASSQVEADHHALLWWASRGAAGFGLNRYQLSPGQSEERPPVGVLIEWAGLGSTGTEISTSSSPAGSETASVLSELGQAVPTRVDAQPVGTIVTLDEIAAPDTVRQMIGEGAVLVLCDSADDVLRFPGHMCSRLAQSIDPSAIPVDDDRWARLWVAYRSGPPAVERMLVVGGALWMMTAESLERLDSDTMASASVIPMG